MKQIGILTTYFATNFGAMLQPFALKRTLEQLGYEVEMIRYKQPKVYFNYKVFKLRRIVTRHIRSAFNYVCSLPILIKKACVFRKYQYKYIQPQKGFVDCIPPNKDFYFMGSDQIWNPVVTGGFDDVYFGSFPTKDGAIKIAYAASAEAIEYTDSQVEYLKSRLKNFHHIAVREKKLANDLMKFTGISNIKTVVDPTILANPSIYEEITHINPMEGRKFVLFYKIRNCWSFMPQISQYAKSIGAEILILSSWYEKEIEEYTKQQKGITYLPTAGVEIFLGAIKNAECVFTPSFHGCVFSILYHRCFYGLVLDDSWNTRVNELLCMTHLENRLLKSEGIIDNTPIDFDTADKELNSQRVYALNYIKHSLGLL